MKKRVVLMFGGKSAEHEVSVASAKNIYRGLDKEKYDVRLVYIDREGCWSLREKIEEEHVAAGCTKARGKKQSAVASIAGAFAQLGCAEGGTVFFPALHGTYGEDGTLQGLFDMMQVPYVGNGVLASACGMDKAVMKRIFADLKIPQANYLTVVKSGGAPDAKRVAGQIECAFGFPCYVKPANMGSSVGISRCAGPDTLAGCLEYALRYDTKLVIEEEITGREIILALKGNGSVKCSAAGEWRRGTEFFDYDSKYKDADLTPVIPADIKASVYKKMYGYARRAYRTLEGSGLMRADFFLTDNDEIYLNEVNTLPGFTEHSMFPLLWERTSGLSFPALLDQLIALGFARHRMRQKLSCRKEDL
jgi:D-alanine-D-alanine ligase